MPGADTDAWPLYPVKRKIVMQSQQYWFGLPKHLLWGFIAIAIFMSGDGFEMAFL